MRLDSIDRLVADVGEKATGSKREGRANPSAAGMRSRPDAITARQPAVLLRRYCAGRVLSVMRRGFDVGAGIT